jgi:DNA helicase-2/ATP-dependent DNA helicase PcrA
MRAFPQKFGYRVIAEIETNKLEIDVERARPKRAADS